MKNPKPDRPNGILSKLIASTCHPSERLLRRSSGANKLLVMTGMLGLSICLSHAAVQVPIEVNSFTAGNAIESATVELKSGSTPNRLWLKVHNLSYSTQASIRVNGGNWVDLKNDTPELTMFRKARNFGGIGGANFTIYLTVDLPLNGAGSAVAGQANTVDFRFNGTDGNAMGFRVLNFDFLDYSDSMRVAAGEITEQNPDNWTKPSGYTSASAVTAGKALWEQRNKLANSPLTPNQLIVASCSDCHTKDGYDLKYFSYSNKSIIDRSRFHGLTNSEGNRIAAYIRSLSYPNPGRPWNPPFQPGPGLDAKPIKDWAAGAGIDSVVNEDADVIDYMPDPTVGNNWKIGNHIKPYPIHDIPLHIQLFDWNRWLPKVHPLDMKIDGMPPTIDFLTDPLYTTYKTVVDGLDADRDAYITGSGFRGALGAMGKQIGSISVDASPFKIALNPDPDEDEANGDFGESQAVVDNVYSSVQWSAVKLFEIMHQYDLVSVPRLFWGYNARDRQWFANRHIFDLSPHRQRILAGSATATAIGDGVPRTMNLYLSMAWYELQRQLNSSARSAVTTGFGTIDWEYVDGVMKETSNQTNEERDAYWRLNWMRSAMEQGDQGFSPYGGAQNYRADSAINFQDHSAYFLRFINGDGSRDDGSSWGDPLVSTADENSFLTPAFQVWLESFARFSQSDWTNAVNSTQNSGRYSYTKSIKTITSSDPLQWKGPLSSHPAKVIRMAQALARDPNSRDFVMNYRPEGMHTAIVNALVAMGKGIWPGNPETQWSNFFIARNNGPAAPAVPTATAQNGKIKLTWNSVGGAQSYNVKRRESSSEPWWTTKFFVDGTQYIDEDLNPSKTYQYCISANGVQYEGADSGSVSLSPNTGLVAYWSFNESSGAPQESESPSGMRHGVPIESPYTGILGTVNQNVDGVSGKGIRFQGYGHVSIPVSLNFALGRTASVSAWMGTDPGEIDVPPVLGAVGSDAADEMLWGYVDSDGKIAFDFASKKVTGPPVNNGEWHHIAMTRDQSDGKIRLYVDGVLKQTATDNTKYMERARVFRIGGSYVDELKVYNHVLSLGDIQALAVLPPPPAPGGIPHSLMRPRTFRSPLHKESRKYPMLLPVAVR